MISYEDIEQARRTLGLPLEACLSDIKTAYKQRLKETHPDKRPRSETAEAEAETEGLIWAYETIMAYVAQYPYSFDHEQYKKVRRRDPTWAVTRFWREMQEP